MSFKLCAAGDTILTRPLADDYEGFEELKHFFSQADVRFNNLEIVLADYDCCASAYCGTPWLCTDPVALDEMKEAFSFDCYGFANNHTLDYFYTGLESTLQSFHSRGIPVCGAGYSLAEATEHRKITTPKGSVAFLGLTTTCDDSARAGAEMGPFPARPGVSKLRHSEKFYVTEEQMTVLRQIAAQTGMNGRADNSRAGGYLPTKPGVFPLGAIDFAVGEPHKESTPNAYDMARYEAAVKAAKADADHVVVYVHTHEVKAALDEEPDFFMETFARSCIDWGADAVICSGTHQIKAVEIYKGAPVFYSIANFIFQLDGSKYYPVDWYERFGVDKTLSARDAEFVRSKGGTIGLETESYAYRSILPVLEWDDKGKLIRISAQPLGLGFDGPAELKGLPRFANAQEARLLLDQIRKLSAPYGTTVTVDADGQFVFTR